MNEDEKDKLIEKYAERQRKLLAFITKILQSIATPDPSLIEEFKWLLGDMRTCQ